MRGIVTILLAAQLLLTIPTVQAAVTEASLQQQILALTEYLERLRGVGGPLSSADYRQIIADGVAWTLTAQEENGHFSYEYAPFAGEYVDGEGMVRQAGTLFMLSEVYLHQQEKDPEVAAAIEKALEYFESISTEGEEEGVEFWCIRNSERGSTCDLGSASLALIGVLNYVAAEPDKAAAYETTIDRYVSYLKLARFPERGFSSRYYVGEGFGERESPFYNGEAMLALVKYHQYRAEVEVKETLEEVFLYLSAQAYESPLYLWIMAALKEMQQLWPNEAYVAYASDFTATRLASARLRHGTTHNYCAPLEGLTSAYSVLAGSESAVSLAELRAEIEYWLARSASLQLSQARPYRVNTTAGQLRLERLPDPARAHGGFLTGEGTLTQRIDFTQHCVSAYLQTLVDIDGEWL